MRAELRAARSVWLVVPGSPDTKTGGYLYDRRIMEELAELGWATHVLALGSSQALPAAAVLDRAREGFDAIPDGGCVIIDGLALTGLLPLLPAVAGRLDLVALIHHPLADETGLDPERAAVLAAAEKKALALVGQVIVTSPWTRRRLADFGVAGSRITVVEPGIDRERSQQRVPSAAVRLLSVATITPRKGHAMLIDALARLRDLDWSLRCVGSLDLDRACADALRVQIARVELTDRVQLTGELSTAGVHEELARADLFVLTSYLEGYGMALAEALAHGLPIVSTNAGAIPDTVPPAAAELVPPGDVDALVQVLRRLLADRTELERLASGARAAAASQPSWPEAGRRLAAALAGKARG
jgi:glycosyltransferase involved in cell wall biosynthesis